MNRLQKYNQIILALAGTAVLGVTLLLLGTFLVKEVFRTTKPMHNAILNGAQLEQDRKAGIRRQKAEFNQVSFTNQITSDWTWSAVEVTVKTLEKPEERKMQNLMVEREMVSNNSSSYRSYWGRDITNLILWNKASSENRLLFANRVVIESTEYYGVKDMDYVLVVARDATSKRPSLYHYSVADAVLTTIDTNGHVPTNLFNVSFGKGNVLPSVTLAVDTDQDGKYDSEQEVTFPARFNPQTLKIEPVISDETKSQAQKVLDGETTE